MFVGKWNKSVILTYVGLIVSMIGMYFAIVDVERIKYSFLLLGFAGICDLFDGFIARKCKRTEEEKAFGVELDSLVDVFNFIAFPIVIFICLGLTNWYHIMIYAVYAICGIARLGYFKITVEDSSKPFQYYMGLPVTYVALIYPVIYMLNMVVDFEIVKIILTIFTMMVALFFVLKVKIKKPSGIWYVVFLLLAIIVAIIYFICL